MRHILILPLILLSGCGSQTSRYELTNDSSNSVKDVVFEIGDDIYRYDEIAPEEKISFSIIPWSEQDSELTFTRNGSVKSAGLCYQTFLLGARNVVIIRDDDIERRCEG